MSDVSEKLKHRISADPKILEVAHVIARHHAEEIRRILVEDGDDPVKSIGRLADLVAKATPRDTPGTPTDSPTPTGLPTPTGSPTPTDPGTDSGTVGIVLIVVLAILWMAGVLDPDRD